MGASGSFAVANSGWPGRVEAQDPPTRKTSSHMYPNCINDPRDRPDDAEDEDFDPERYELDREAEDEWDEAEGDASD